MLGPPLGRLLLPDSPYTFVGPVLTGLHREPTEQGRYLIAICAPLLAALALATVPARRTRIPDRAVGPIVVGTQLVLAGMVVASIVAQYGFRFGLAYRRGFQPTFGMHYFSPRHARRGAFTIAAALMLRSRRSGGA